MICNQSIRRVICQRLIVHRSRRFGIILVEFYRIGSRRPLCKEFDIIDASIRNSLYSLTFIKVAARIPTAKNIAEFCRVFERDRRRSNIILFGVCLRIRSAVQVIFDRIIDNFPHRGVCSVTDTVIANRNTVCNASKISSCPTGKRIAALCRIDKCNVCTFNRVRIGIESVHFTAVEIILNVVIDRRPLCKEFDVTGASGCNRRNFALCSTIGICIPSLKCITATGCIFKINIRTCYGVFGRILFAIYTTVKVISDRITIKSPICNVFSIADAV